MASPVLEPLGRRHRGGLRPIVADSGVMCWVGRGDVWNAAALDQFVDYGEQEQAQPASARTNWYWAIVVDGEVAGVVGVHPAPYQKKVGDEPGTRVVTIFIARDHQRRGLGRWAIAQALERAPSTGPVYFDVRRGNLPMLGFLERHGGQKKANLRVGSARLERWFLTGPLPAVRD